MYTISGKILVNHTEDLEYINCLTLEIKSAKGSIEFVDIYDNTLIEKVKNWNIGTKVVVAIEQFDKPEVVDIIQYDELPIESIDNERYKW